MSLPILFSLLGLAPGLQIVAVPLYIINPLPDLSPRSLCLSAEVATGALQDLTPVCLSSSALPHPKPHQAEFLAVSLWCLAAS